MLYPCLKVLWETVIHMTQICGPFVDCGVDEKNVDFIKQDLIDKYIVWVDKKCRKLGGEPLLHNSAAASEIIFMMFENY